MEEIWKDIDGYEGKYQVSNTGKARSMNFNNTGKIKELKPKLNHCGYYEVTLSKHNKTKVCMLGRLVAQAFIPNPQHKQEVMFISKDKLDTSVNNLKWGFKCETRFNMYKKGSRETGKPSKCRYSYKRKKFKTISAMARHFHRNPKAVLERLYDGWELKLAIKVPVDKNNSGGKPYFYEYYGKMMSVYQISKFTGINSTLINRRLSRGWNIYEAAEIKKGVN